MFTKSLFKECYKLDKGKCLTPMESLCRFWVPKVEIQMSHVGMHLGVTMECSGGGGLCLQLVFVKSIWILLISFFSEMKN